MRRHFAFVPQACFHEHYHLGPRELHAWGQHRLLKTSINGTGNLMSHNRARFGDDWQPGRGMGDGGYY